MTQHVAIVDDAAVNLTILTSIVSERPETTAHAFGSSNDALAFAREHTLDAFVLDYHMPDPDGLAMVGILRADERYALVPIIIVTGEHDRESRLAALAAGANDYIERPVEPRELLAKLDTLLTLHSARRRLSQNVSELTASLEIKEQHAREQAERMVALWRIITKSDLPVEDLPHTILFEGARALRPAQKFHGVLQRLDGDDVILEAKTRLRIVDRQAALVGARFPLSTQLASLLSADTTTRAWNDLFEAGVPAGITWPRRNRARAAIVTTFFAGRSQYFLEFWSTEPVVDPFTAEDVTYVELLGSFFAAHVQQAWQLDRMTYHLSHDTLTGLRNRTQFRLDARAALGAQERGAMAVVSLDGFHFVNETYGHIIGDALLVEVGAALQCRAMGDEIVARLAGDNFGIFLPGVGDEATARERLAIYAAAFEHGFSTGDREGREFIKLSATIGGAVGDKYEASVDTLLSRAHTAAFASRRNGRGGMLLYETNMESEEVERDRRLAELALALDRGEFELYFQPHIEVDTNRVVGAEALIRWNHPTRGTVLPDDFIPFAEKNNKIRSISRWVMESAFAAAERLRTIDPAFRVYFNLSAHDLAGMEIITSFREAAAAGVHLENVGVELTETAAIQDIGMTVQTVKALQELGVCVAIDDFGTGYSSLSFLKRLPVDVVKIDRSFVNEVLLGERDAAIAEAVIGFGERFGFATLGEGVENAGQLAWLRERRCQYAQGYSIAHPQPLATFVEWLEARRTDNHFVA